MADYVNQVFEDQDVVLDGGSFTGCTFRRCAIVFRGTGPVHLERNHFQDCQWRFDGAAGAALKHLAFMYAQGGDFRELVENTFNSIRGQKTTGTTLH